MNLRKIFGEVRKKNFLKQHAILLIFIFTFSLLFLLSTAKAQNIVAPSINWSTFNIDSDVDRAQSVSYSALRLSNCEIWDEGGGVLIGGNNIVVVEVVCISLGGKKTQVTVSAFSSDYAYSEKIRNDVREYIVNAKDL